jgi:effector-binding domain-containing protein
MQHTVAVRDVEAQPTLSVRTQTGPAGLGAAIGVGIGEIVGYLAELRAAPAGAPAVVYHTFGPEEIDLEVIVPVAPGTPGRGRIEAGEIPAGTVASTLHEGPYEGEREAYADLATWMEEHGYQPAGPPRETYLVGPADSADPDDYRTEIAWPVR